MHNEFTAIIEKDGEWFIAYCPEIPGANGQGRTKEGRPPVQPRQAVDVLGAQLLKHHRDHPERPQYGEKVNAKIE